MISKEVLSNRIWCTRKSRMNAEARYLIYDQLSTFIIPYYGVTFLCFQLAPKYLVNIKDQGHVEWFATSCSIVMMVFSIIIGTQGFREKAEEMKKCYLKLGQISSRLNSSNVDSINQEYNDCLSEFNNHLNIDYWKIFIFKKLNQSEGGWDFFIRHCKYLFYVSIFYVFFTVITLFPVYVFFEYIFPQF